MRTIASLIREKLYNSPNGATTQEIAAYCVRNGAVFKTHNIQKSVSGQLSKMNLYHYDVGGYYVWSIYPESYAHTNNNLTAQSQTASCTSSYQNTTDAFMSTDTENSSEQHYSIDTSNIITEEKSATCTNNENTPQESNYAIVKSSQNVENTKVQGFPNILAAVIIILLVILIAFALIAILKHFTLILAAIILFVWFYIVTS